MDALTDNLENNDDIDFYKLESKLENEIKLIWQNVIIPYLDLEDCILDLNENDFKKFDHYIFNNNKYYKFLNKLTNK